MIFLPTLSLKKQTPLYMKWGCYIVIILCALFMAGCGRNDAAFKKGSGAPAETASEKGPVQETEPEKEEPSETPGQEAEEEPVVQSVRIIMVGDILLHTPVEKAAKNDETGEYDFDFIFDHSREIISEADIAIANQEVIIGGEELGVSGYPAFNAPYEVSDALYNAGFDVICHGTNHALDRGSKGIVNCLDNWRKTYPDMLVLGIYDNEQDASAERVPIIERNGIRVAVLNYTYGTNGIPAPADMPYAVSLLDKERVVAQLDIAEKEADFTIVCPHWGTEYNLGISSYQKKWTEIFREHGADAVIGTHPHVIEPVVFYEDEDADNITNNHGGGDMPVFYSLGNFVNWTSGTGKGVANRMVGGMADISISRKENGEVSIDDHSVHSFVCHVRSGDRNVTVYPLEEYSEELASQNEIRKQDSSFSREYCDELISRVY